jgi:hypothetical protein
MSPPYSVGVLFRLFAPASCTSTVSVFSSSSPLSPRTRVRAWPCARARLMMRLWRFCCLRLNRLVPEECCKLCKLYSFSLKSLNSNFTGFFGWDGTTFVPSDWTPKFSIVKIGLGGPVDWGERGEIVVVAEWVIWGGEGEGERERGSGGNAERNLGSAGMLEVCVKRKERKISKVYWLGEKKLTFAFGGVNDRFGSCLANISNVRL